MRFIACSYWDFNICHYCLKLEYSNIANLTEHLDVFNSWTFEEGFLIQITGSRMTRWNPPLTSHLSSVCFIDTSICWVRACVGILRWGVFYRNVVVVSTSDRWGVWLSWDTTWFARLALWDFLVSEEWGGFFCQEMLITSKMSVHYSECTLL